MSDGGRPIHDAAKLLDEAVEVDDEVSAPTHAAVAELAYSYWEARGGHGGSPWEDWFRAESELKKRGD